MNMSILQNIFMGFVSGFAELLPISAEGHRSILRTLMGIDSEDAVFRFLIHMSVLAAVIWGNREEIWRLRRAARLMKVPARRRKIQPDMPTVFKLRSLRTACAVMLVLKFFTWKFSFIANEAHLISFAMIGNGILLLIPSLVRNGNKDSRNMLRLDGIVMGLGAGLSVIPGFSQVGASTAAGIIRGVDRKYALDFAYILMIPGILINMVFDIVAMIGGSAAVFSGIGLLGVILGAAFCYIGCILAQKLMRFVAFSSNFSSFSYYCWGAGLFMFVLFLTV